jgi:hypothetical protein
LIPEFSLESEGKGDVEFSATRAIVTAIADPQAAAAWLHPFMPSRALLYLLLPIPMSVSAPTALSLSQPLNSD